MPGSVTQAHIHFGQENVNGAIIAPLCGPGSKVPTCPQNGVLTGTITPADILVISTQNIGTDDYDKFERALFAGKTYVNIHTTRVSTGELRGQIYADALQ